MPWPHAPAAKAQHLPKLEKALGRVVQGLAKGTRAIWFAKEDAKRCKGALAAQCQRFVAASAQQQKRAPRGVAAALARAR